MRHKVIKQTLGQLVYYSAYHHVHHPETPSFVVPSKSRIEKVNRRARVVRRASLVFTLDPHSTFSFCAESSFPPRVYAASVRFVSLKVDWIGRSVRSI